MDYVTGLQLLVDLKNDNYNAILDIFDCLTKIVHYKLIKTTIDIISLVEVIINVVVKYCSLLELIICNQSLLFTLKL